MTAGGSLLSTVRSPRLLSRRQSPAQQALTRAICAYAYEVLLSGHCTPIGAEQLYESCKDCVDQACEKSVRATCEATAIQTPSVLSDSTKQRLPEGLFYVFMGGTLIHLAETRTPLHRSPANS